jgi:small GTP-binding protein
MSSFVDVTRTNPLGDVNAASDALLSGTMCSSVSELLATLTTKASTMSTFEHLFYIVFIGDSSVGKSLILRTLCPAIANGRGPLQPTIGVEFATRIVLNGLVKLLLWDCSGDDRFRSIANSYLRGAHSAFLVFDTTNRASFERLASLWLPLVRDLASDDIVLTVVGTTRAGEERCVSASEAQEFAERSASVYVQIDPHSSTDCEAMLLEPHTERVLATALAKQVQSATVQSQRQQRASACELL